MSAKLVKKGLELVLGDGHSRAESSKLKNKKKSLKRLKKKHRSCIEGKKKESHDHTEKNLKYFLGSTWELKEETKKRILEHQTKSHKGNQVSEDAKEEDEWIFNFDLDDAQK